MLVERFGDEIPKYKTKQSKRDTKTKQKHSVSKVLLTILMIESDVSDLFFCFFVFLQSGIEYSYNEYNISLV